MEGYTRRTRCRSRSHPLSLEVLEDRFLLSAIGYPAEGMGAPMPASGGQPPAAVSSSPAASQDQKAANRAAASPSPGSSPSTHSSPPTPQGGASVLSWPAISGAPPGAATLQFNPDAGDRGSGLNDHDGDSLYQGAVVASLVGMYYCSPVGNGLGTNDCTTEPLPGAAPVPSHAAVPSLAPSGAAMGLREATPTIAGPPPRPEGVGAEVGIALVPGNREPPNAAVEAAPVEPQGLPPTAENDRVLLPAGLPLAGLLPIDLDTIRRAADAFFTRLTDLAQDPSLGHSAVRVVPWLGVLTVVAYEWARMHRMPSCRSEDGWGQGNARLPEGEA
jgi:hypothetical protein